MTDLVNADSLFFARTGMDPDKVERLVGEALSGMDDGELFLEYSQSESFAFDDGRLKAVRASVCGRLRAKRRAMPIPAS